MNNADICKLAAEIYGGKDWHKLSSKERDLVEMLENRGYITQNNPANGFVGRACK